jgi:hypothetical protein
MAWARAATLTLSFCSPCSFALSMSTDSFNYGGSASRQAHKSNDDETNLGFYDIASGSQAPGHARHHLFDLRYLFLRWQLSNVELAECILIVTVYVWCVTRKYTTYEKFLCNFPTVRRQGWRKEKCGGISTNIILCKVNLKISRKKKRKKKEHRPTMSLE